MTTLPTIANTDPCSHCAGGSEGCEARRLFGGEPCCRRCTHERTESP